MDRYIQLKYILPLGSAVSLPEPLILSYDGSSSTNDPILLFPDECTGPHIGDITKEANILSNLSLNINNTNDNEIRFKTYGSSNYESIILFSDELATTKKNLTSFSNSA